MEQEFSFTIEEDVYEKFYLAVHLAKEDEGKALETCLKWYIAKTCEKVSHAYRPKISEKWESKEKEDYYAKANKKIPVWAKRSEQNCHKIIRSFFMCQEQYGQVLLNDMEELCSKEEIAELYVPRFKNNYYRMKFDAVKTYGKVFEDDGKIVSIWSEVEEVLLEYKDYFCN